MFHQNSNTGGPTTPRETITRAALFRQAVNTLSPRRETHTTAGRPTSDRPRPPPPGAATYFHRQARPDFTSTSLKLLCDHKVALLALGARCTSGRKPRPEAQAEAEAESPVHNAPSRHSVGIQRWLHPLSERTRAPCDKQPESKVPRL